MRLLVVEDERDLNRAIAKGLSKAGYAVDSAYDGEEALDMFDVNEYDLILIDLNLHKVDGIEVLKEIRKKNLFIRIMILSARSNVEDRVLGLDLGANDYMIKPFDFKELEARVRTLLRISYRQSPSVLMHDDIRLDTNTKEVFIIDKKVNLTRKEYAILEYLILNKERLVTSEEIFEHVWNNEADEFSNTLKYHMHALKRKLYEAGEKEYIANKRGLGYHLRKENEKA